MNARRVVRRVVTVGASLVVVLALAAAGLASAWLAGIRIPVASGDVWFAVEKVARADVARDPSAPFFIALIGNDERPGVSGQRGDALHVLGVNPALGQATIVNVPRDMCVDVPGAGFTKINTAHTVGGPGLQADVLGNLLGVDVSYAISVNFSGFQHLVDGVGGVTVDVPTAHDDPQSGASFQPGVTKMNGVQALAFSRNRYDFPSGDLARTTNQGHLIWSAFRELHETADSPTGQMRLLALLGRHAQLDGVGLNDLYHLGRLAFRMDPAKVRNVTGSTGGGGCSGGLAPTADARSLYADFADDAVLQQH
ncbi:MAG TPA: LCP family protein [Acidimicrobiia bacterium]|nr:LCP family protein [Acidimicrobiia bacterium]